MALSISFDGIELSDYIKIYDIARNIGPNYENKINKVGIANGESFSSSTINRKTITISFNVLHDLTEKRRKIAQLLDSASPKKLILGDEPSVYYNAIVDGQTPLAETFFLGKGTVTFIIPDGVAHAIDYDLFTNVDTAKENLFLDSEFINYHKYFKDFCKRGGTRNGSNVLIADFTDLVTLYSAKENWLPETMMVTRPVSVKKGESVSFGVELNINTFATDNSNHALVILEEREKVGGNILYRHKLIPTKIENQWQKLTDTIIITNSATKALCLTFGVYGNAKISICKPQFNLGEKLNPYAASALTVSNTIEVTNAGTYKTFPEIEVTMQGENGLVGIVNSNGGVLQYGDENDVDIEHSVRKDKVVDYGWRSTTLPSGVSLNDKSMPSTYPNFKDNENTPNLVQGSVNWDGGEAIYPTFTGVGDIGVWHGPSISFQIPKSTNNTSDGDFLSAQRLYFKNPVNIKTARARMEYVIADENKKVFMAVVIRDSTTLSNELIVEFWYKNRLVKSASLSRKTYDGEFFEIHMDRMKSNKELRWRFSQIKSLNPATDGAFTNHNHEFIMKFTEKELTNAVYEKCWFLRYSNSHHNYMYWTDSKLYWTNEAVYTNIENLFDDGDILNIDTKNRKVMLNNVENTELHKLGNQYQQFQLDYGKHMFQIIASNYAITPLVTVKLQKNYL